ncbi:MAG TPA: cupin domain-containing protein [Chitinophagaceae bacterium]|jgi:quercetin 2,3-dioxygenase|nr:cupin domain-containing protein [Chitinophagaceae bacterium]
MDRKHFVTLAGFGAALITSRVITGCAPNKKAANGTASVPAPKAIRAEKAIYVPNGKNRFREELMIWGIIPLQIKISSRDTEGSYFVFEHSKMSKGGPPRHFHFEQDEWFYAVEGEFAFEVGDEKFTLHAGDSLFAPRMIPHVWAYLGDKPGTLLLAVQPAGSLEEFFMKSCSMPHPPSPEEADKLFAAHGMKVVGPPLFAS